MIFFVLIITLMLSRIFSEALMSTKQLQNYTITKLSQKVLLHLCYIASKTFLWEVPWFSNNGCSEFHQVNWPLYNIYSLISPKQQLNYQLEKR